MRSATASPAAPKREGSLFLPASWPGLWKFSYETTVRGLSHPNAKELDCPTPENACGPCMATTPALPFPPLLKAEPKCCLSFLIGRCRMSNAPMRVLIVDDEPIARRGIRQLLAAEQDTEIGGEARNGKEAVRLLRTLSPDLVF